MAVDFVAHLGHAFNRALEAGKPSLDAMEEAISLMGPSISMAAASTSIAGGVMLISETCDQDKICCPTFTQKQTGFTD